MANEIACVARAVLKLRLPEGAKHEADCPRNGKSRHGLVLDRVIDRTLHAAGQFLNSVPHFATLIGHTSGQVLGPPSHVAQRIHCLVDDLLELIGCGRPDVGRHV